MRTSTLRLRAETLRAKVHAARSQKAVVDLVDEFVVWVMLDKRLRVTDELKAMILVAHAEGHSLEELELKFNLSAPTLRKVIAARTQT